MHACGEKSGSKLGITEFLEAATRVIWAIPRDIPVGRQGHHQETAIHRPRNRGRDQGRSQTLSGATGTNRDLLKMGLSIQNIQAKKSRDRLPDHEDGLTRPQLVHRHLSWRQDDSRLTKHPVRLRLDLRQQREVGIDREPDNR